MFVDYGDSVYNILKLLLSFFPLSILQRCFLTYALQPFITSEAIIYQYASILGLKIIVLKLSRHLQEGDLQNPAEGRKAEEAILTILTTSL